MEPAGTSFVVADLPALSGLNPLPVATWDGSSYLIVWWAGSILGAGSNGDGSSPPFGISASGVAPSVAANAHGDSVVLFGTGCGAISSRIVGGGALEPEPAQREVSLDASPQFNPRSARVSGGTQVVWEESRAGSSAAVMSSFVAQDGNVAPVRQLTEDGSYSGSPSEIVPVAAGSAVIWNELRGGVTGGLRIQRFDGSGNPLAAPLPIGAAQVFTLAAAANGRDIGVAFTQTRPTSFVSDFYVAVADASSNVQQTSLSQVFSANSTIARLGAGFLVVWRENQGSATPLFSAVVDRNANVLSKQLILGDSSVPAESALAVDDNEALFVWSNIHAGTFDLTALPLDPSGTPKGTAFPISSSPSALSPVRVIPEGGAFLITYLAMDGGNAPREVRQTTVRGGGRSHCRIRAQ